MSGRRFSLISGCSLQQSSGTELAQTRKVVGGKEFIIFIIMVTSGFGQLNSGQGVGYLFLEVCKVFSIYEGIENLLCVGGQPILSGVGVSSSMGQMKHTLKKRYCKWLVGLICTNVVIKSGLRFMSISMVLVWGQFHVKLNGDLELRFRRNSARESGPLVHNNVLSMNMIQVKCFNGQEFRKSCSSCSMNRLKQKRANRLKRTEYYASCWQTAQSYLKEQNSLMFATKHLQFACPSNCWTINSISNYTPTNFISKKLHFVSHF